MIIKCYFNKKNLFIIQLYIRAYIIYSILKQKKKNNPFYIKMDKIKFEDYKFEGILTKKYFHFGVIIQV